MAFTEKRLYGPTVVTGFIDSVVYTCPTEVVTTTTIKQIIVTNTTSNTYSFSMNLIPSGNSVSINNRVFSNVSLPSNETIMLNLSQVLTSGDKLSANIQGVGVNMTISGIENQGGMVVSGLADNAVTTAKIANGNVTASKLGPDAFLSNGQAGAIMLMEMM